MYKDLATIKLIFEEKILFETLLHLFQMSWSDPFKTFQVTEWMVGVPGLTMNGHGSMNCMTVAGKNNEPQYMRCRINKNDRLFTQVDPHNIYILRTG